MDQILEQLAAMERTLAEAMQREQEAFAKLLAPFQQQAPNPVDFPQELNDSQ